jgi:hypothetical protein
MRCSKSKQCGRPQWMKVLNIAAANGGVHGKDKAEMAEKMTKKQIAKAQDLSREMIEANPKLMGD